MTGCRSASKTYLVLASACPMFSGPAKRQPPPHPHSPLGEVSFCHEPTNYCTLEIRQTEAGTRLTSILRLLVWICVRSPPGVLLLRRPFMYRRDSLFNNVKRRYRWLYIFTREQSPLTAGHPLCILEIPFLGQILYWPTYYGCLASFYASS